MRLPDYYSRVNPDLLRWIPPDARVVLEVGCGAGAMAGAYRVINPTVCYLGIEKMPEAARAAESPTRVDRVVTGDAELVQPEALGLPRLESGAPPIVD